MEAKPQIMTSANESSLMRTKFVDEDGLVTPVLKGKEFGGYKYAQLRNLCKLVGIKANLGFQGILETLEQLQNGILPDTALFTKKGMDIRDRLEGTYTSLMERESLFGTGYKGSIKLIKDWEYGNQGIELQYGHRYCSVYPKEELYRLRAAYRYTMGTKVHPLYKIKMKMTEAEISKLTSLRSWTETFGSFKD